MKVKTKTSHVTPAGGNVFLDLGFTEAEAIALKAEAENIIANKRLKQIPEFKDEVEEREFWQREDSTEYIDVSNAKLVKFQNLKKAC